MTHVSNIDILRLFTFEKATTWIARCNDGASVSTLLLSDRATAGFPLPQRWEGARCQERKPVRPDVCRTVVALSQD